MMSPRGVVQPYFSEYFLPPRGPLGSRTGNQPLGFRAGDETSTSYRSDRSNNAHLSGDGLHAPTERIPSRMSDNVSVSQSRNIATLPNNMAADDDRVNSFQDFNLNRVKVESNAFEDRGFDAAERSASSGVHISHRQEAEQTNFHHYDQSPGLFANGSVVRNLVFPDGSSESGWLPVM